MGDNGVINTSKSADLVTFKILIGKDELPASYSVMNIVVDKEINRISSAKIILLDGSPDEQDFTLSNQKLLIPGTEIVIKAGYHSDEETIFKGIIIKHNLKIRSNQSFLIIECKDKAVKLTIGRKSKYFYKSKDSKIIEEIIDTYGLDKDVQPTKVEHKEMMQYNVSDWDFCVARAQANGKVCILDDGKIIVQKPDIKQSELETVTFGTTLLDFDAEIDARNQFAKITSYSWSAADQDLVEKEANDPSVTLNGNFEIKDLSSVINLENLELKSGGGTPDVEIQEWADAKLFFYQLAKVRGRVKFQGIPGVKPNTILKLAGVGDRFNGKVYVSGVRHQITEGNWTVDAQFGIDPNWFSETVNINDTPASGLLSAVNGLQVALVSQLEKDPDKEDRILVRFPIVDKKEQGVWARVATLDAGDNRGSFFRPEIDDEVIVGFINGNPNDPIVLGMMNSSKKPAPIAAKDDNHEKGFVTRSKMKFIFNDEKKSVVLETPAGKKITIDEDAGIIQLEDENSNKITMDSGNILISTDNEINIKAGGNINIEGDNVNIKGKTEGKFEAPGITVEGSSQAALKGGTVLIN